VGGGRGIKKQRRAAAPLGFSKFKRGSEKKRNGGKLTFFGSKRETRNTEGGVRSWVASNHTLGKEIKTGEKGPDQTVFQTSGRPWVNGLVCRKVNGGKSIKKWYRGSWAKNVAVGPGPLERRNGGAQKRKSDTEQKGGKMIRQKEGKMGGILKGRKIEGRG